jgi:acyl-ACP thioesterase
MGFDIGIENILFGNASFENDKNSKLFLLVQKYIINSKRFVPFEPMVTIASVCASISTSKRFLYQFEIARLKRGMPREVGTTLKIHG